MKKFLIAIVIALTLIGCSKEKEIVVAQAGTIIEYKDYTLEIKRGSVLDIIEPVVRGDSYDYYQAKDNKSFYVVYATITTKENTNIKLKNVKLELDLGKKMTAKTVTMADEGDKILEDFDFAANSTREVIFFVDAKEITEPAYFSTSKIKYQLNLDFFVKNTPIAVGGQMNFGTSQITLNSIVASTELKPKNPSEIYNYYTSKDKNYYLIIDLTLLNNAEQNINAQAISSARLIIDGKTYRALMITEDDENNLVTNMELPAAGSAQAYFLFEIPDNLETQDVTFIISSHEYHYKVDVPLPVIPKEQ